MSTPITDAVVRTTRTGRIDPELAANFHADVVARGLDSLTSPVTTATSVTYPRADGEVSLTVGVNQTVEIDLDIDPLGSSHTARHQWDVEDHWDYTDRIMAIKGLTAEQLRAAR